MKAIVQDALGEPADVLKVIDMADGAELGAGEVLIDVTLAPVHHGDLALIRSQPQIPDDPGHVPRGSEAIGVVRALGSDVAGRSRIAVGDRVIAFPSAGSWAERVVVPAFAAIPVPPGVGDEVAGQLLINFVTAHTILRSLRASVPDETLRNGTVLVTGAGTVVARLLLHMLGEEGLTAIGLARGRATADRIAADLEDVSLTSTDQPDWKEQVTSFAAGRKIVGVLDCVSGPLLVDLAPLLADGAVIVTYGALGGDRFGVGACRPPVRHPRRGLLAVVLGPVGGGTGRRRPIGVRGGRRPAVRVQDQRRLRSRRDPRRGSRSRSARTRRVRLPPALTAIFVNHATERNPHAHRSHHPEGRQVPRISRGRLRQHLRSHA